MFGVLAYRMIAKAASDVPEDGSTLPSKAIHNSQELQLLLQILDSQNKTQEGIKWLRSKSIGMGSAIVQSEEWVFLSKYISLLELMEAKAEIIHVTQNALKGIINDYEVTQVSEKTTTATGNNSDGINETRKVWQDDWKIWQSLIHASGKEILGASKTTPDIDNDRSNEDLHKILARHTNVETPSRNALLAQVACSLAIPNKGHRLQEACQLYFNVMKSRSCCFDDLAPYVQKLDADESKSFLKYVENATKTARTEEGKNDEKQNINLCGIRTSWLKFLFMIKIDKQESPNSKELNFFLLDCFSNYTSSLALGKDLLVTDNQYGDETLLLSIKALIANAGSPPAANSLHTLYIPIILLEHLLKRSAHNFSALLLLVRLYLLVGAFSLASITFQKLNIKQIQNDTLAYSLLTRISTLFPFSSPSVPTTHASTNNPDIGIHAPTNPSDSVEILTIACKIYRSSTRQAPDMINLAFENGSYGQILDFIEFRRKVDTSLCKFMWQIEKRRAQRLRGISEMLTCRWDAALETEMSDNRDLTIFGLQNWISKCAIGPIPKAKWVKAFTLVDAILLRLSVINPLNTEGFSTTAFKPITRSLEPKDELEILLNSGDMSEFLPTETDALKLSLLVGQCEYEVRQAKSSIKAKEGINKILQILKKVLQSLIDGISNITISLGSTDINSDTKFKTVHTWESIHTSFTILDVKILFSSHPPPTFLERSILTNHIVTNLVVV